MKEGAYIEHIKASIKSTRLRNIPDMTVKEHHVISVGLLACCYEQIVDETLRQAIREAFTSAVAMGMKIKPEMITDVRAFGE